MLKYESKYHTPYSAWNVYDHIVVSRDGSVELLNCKEETNTMSDKFSGKKHYLVGGANSKHETRAEAETAAKKYMETYSKAYGYGNDATIYEAVATVKFPLPAYEVVDLAKA